MTIKQQLDFIRSQLSRARRSGLDCRDLITRLEWVERTMERLVEIECALKIGERKKGKT